MKNNLALIFFENPISRSYLKICNIRNFKFKKIIVLRKKSFLPKSVTNIYSFNKMNYYPIQFLKKKTYSSIASQISQFFSYPNNFFEEVYKNNSIENYGEKIDFINTDNINSETFIKSLREDSNLIYLNTGKKIYKNSLDYNFKIIHIHPGYLPNVRGADASLWNIKKLNCFSATSFFMSKKIDDGQILNKSIYEYPKVKLENFNNIQTIELYRFWFSFIDPIIRSKHFDDYILGNQSNEEKIYDSKKKIENKNEYFSFMDELNIKDTIKRIVGSD